MILSLQDGRVLVYAEGLARALKEGRANRDDAKHASEVIELLLARAASLVNALEIAETFIAGFEGDELQEGIDEILTTIRAAIAEAA